VVAATALHEGLTRVIAHPRCWLPRDMVDLRLRRYAEGE